MPGLVLTLRHQFEAWSRGFYRSGQAERHICNLLYNVAQISGSRLSGWPVLEETEALIEHTRAAIAPVFGMSLAGLRRHRGEQSAFAVHALELARLVSEMIRDAREQHALDDSADKTDDEATRTALSLWFDFDDNENENADEHESMAAAVTGAGRVPGASSDDYRIFT